MTGTGTKIAIGAGVAATIGGALYVATRSSAVTPPSVAPAISVINLAASGTSITQGTTVTFTATALDTSGNPVASASLTLFDQSTSTAVSMGTTNSQGAATVTVTFNIAGVFVIYVEA